MSDGLNLTYEEIRAMGTRLENERERLDREVGDLKGEVDDLVESGFQAASSKAFQESFSDFTDGLKQMLEGLEGLGGFLNMAADQFEETDAALEGQARGD